MTDCFISYKREDRPRVEPIVAALREAGHRVWWDADIPGGEHWRETIAARLDGATCVLVCWTEGAVGAQGGYVREEAERARQRGALLPLLLDDVPPPFGFGEVQALDLVDWNGQAGDARWLAVLQAVEARLTGQALAPAPLRRRRWAPVAGVGSAAVLAIGLAADLGGLLSAACKLPAVAGVCAALGAGPSAAEQAAWQGARQAGSREALRAFRARYPDSPFAAEALAREAACAQQATTSWLPHAQRMPVVVPTGPLRPAATASAAQAALQADVQRAADDACLAPAISELYRPQAGASPELDAQGWECKAVDGGGWRCRFDGKVLCRQERRQTLSREVCPSG